MIATRSHACDYESLAFALQSPAEYVGVMGSKPKMAIVRQRLADEACLSAKQIARVYSPIGVQIGAETPEELAISLVAELIQVRAAR